MIDVYKLCGDIKLPVLVGSVRKHYAVGDVLRVTRCMWELSVVEVSPSRRPGNEAIYCVYTKDLAPEDRAKKPPAKTKPVTRHSLARSGAHKICGHGLCFYADICKNAKKNGRFLPSINVKTICPLARYDIKPDSYRGIDRPYLGISVPRRELRALCEECPHSTILKKDGNEVLVKRDFKSFCLDCPVYAEELALSEC